ncbi:MAPEG family protein [Ferrimonas gelatinilytica]|uniref:MAPEG family protein n=1 Tax=Ferrimonas gelatinilytica TaxID=1255257 RepID=A0ABP9SFS4_9GAMM
MLVIMEAIRTKMVLTKEVAPNGFNPENSNLSPFMQRLARAHANCVEGLPIFGGLLAFSIFTGNQSVTDQLAHAFLAARIAQSAVHLLSTSPAAVTLRFSFFAVQMIIGVFWCYKLYEAVA